MHGVVNMPVHVLGAMHGDWIPENFVALTHFQEITDTVRGWMNV